MGQLTYLSLGGNRIGDAGITEFSRAITNGALDDCDSDSIEALYLCLNRVSESAKTTMRTAAMKRNISVEI